MKIGITKEEARQLSALYKSQLRDYGRVGGAFCRSVRRIFNRLRRKLETGFRRRNIWAQARQTYMFAAYYEYSGREEKWLSLAKAGRDFLVCHAYAGEGRWNYEVSENGEEVIEGTTSIFTDLFALIALAQYASASGDQTDYDLIRKTFDSARNHIMDPEFRDIKPHVWQNGIERHSPYMIAVHSSMVAEKVLGKRGDRTVY